MSIQTIQIIRNSIVAIGLGQMRSTQGVRALIHLGTGFCFRRNNIFLTCRHVMGNAPSNGTGLHVMISTNNTGISYIYNIIGWQPVGSLDLAVFKVNDQFAFTPLSLQAEQDIPDGTEIILYGYPESILEWTSINPDPGTNVIPPLSNPALFSRGSVGIVSAQYNFESHDLFEHDIETFPGLSGAPLIKTSDQRVIGINRGHRSIGRKEEYQGPKLAIRLFPYLSQINTAVETLERQIT